MMKLPLVLLLLLATMKICSGNRPMECSEIKNKNRAARSGVYTIYPIRDEPGVEVYCDMEENGGGWTMFQRRMDGTVNFYRSWYDYVYGFGSASSEYWLGLENLHKITKQKSCEMCVSMETFDLTWGAKAWACYATFSVGSSCSYYHLELSGYTGSLKVDGLIPHNGMKFTTYDNDQDMAEDVNCAERHLGGFWYNKCYWANPNGLYLWGTYDKSTFIGNDWNQYGNYGNALKTISMKLRPKK